MLTDFEDLFGEPEESPHQTNDTLEEPNHPCKPRLIRRDNAVLAEYPNLDFTEHVATNPLTVSIEKQPMRLQIGRMYYGGILIDTDYRIFGPLIAACKQLKSLPPKIRARAVLKLLLDKVKYAFPEDMKKLKAINPERANWIEKNTALGNTAEKVNLSDIFKHGYGICYHLAFAYLWLCQQAGLEGTVIPVRDNDIINIQRTDTNQPLFKSVPVGSPAGGHLYVELLLPNGEWLAVDPSTDLISDTEQGKAMFTAARYQAFVSHELQIQTNDRNIGIHKTNARIPAMQGITAQSFQLHVPNKARTLFLSTPTPTVTVVSQPKVFPKIRFTIATAACPDVIQLKIVQAQTG